MIEISLTAIMICPFVVVPAVFMSQLQAIPAECSPEFPLALLTGELWCVDIESQFDVFYRHLIEQIAASTALPPDVFIDATWWNRQ